MSLCYPRVITHISFRILFLRGTTWSCHFMTTGIYAFYEKGPHKRKITSDINHFMNTSCIKYKLINWYIHDMGHHVPILACTCLICVHPATCLYIMQTLQTICMAVLIYYLNVGNEYIHNTWIRAADYYSFSQIVMRLKLNSLRKTVFDVVQVEELQDVFFYK